MNKRRTAKQQAYLWYLYHDTPQKRQQERESARRAMQFLADSQGQRITQLEADLARLEAMMDSMLTEERRA